MRLDELIAQLQKLRDEVGNRQVVVAQYDVLAMPTAIKAVQRYDVNEGYVLIMNHKQKLL